jgi:hypothetical protein
MNIKKAILAFSVSALCIGSVSAEKIEHTLSFTTEIKVDGIEIKPVSGNWPTTPIDLTYDNNSDKFTSYSLPISIKSPEANIYASITAQAHLNSGKAEIPLFVWLDFTPLSTLKSLIHDKSPTANTYNLRISPKVSKPLPGTYTGSVTLVFDA